MYDEILAVAGQVEGGLSKCLFVSRESVFMSISILPHDSQA